MLPVIPVAKLHDRAVPRPRSTIEKVDAAQSLEYIKKGFEKRLLKILSDHIEPSSRKGKEKQTSLPLKDLRKKVIEAEKAKTVYRGIYQDAANEWNKDIKNSEECTTSIESRQIQKALKSGGHNANTMWMEFVDGNIDALYDRAREKYEEEKKEKEEKDESETDKKESNIRTCTTMIKHVLRKDLAPSDRSIILTLLDNKAQLLTDCMFELSLIAQMSLVEKVSK